MKVEITIDGKRYPCRQTMGAMLRFKEETGRDVTEMGNGFSDMCVFLWCCIVSACKHDGIDFGMSLMDFADAVSPEDMETWSGSARSDGNGGDAEKKSL